MIDILLSSLKLSVKITLLIFGLMIIIELLVLRYKDKVIKTIKYNKISKYIVPSFFGIIPGCIGTFAMDSLYMAGLLGFGGITAVMIATSGDEAFLLISMVAAGEIPLLTVVYLTVILFAMGIIGGKLADLFIKKYKIKFCEKCGIINHGDKEFKFKHFIKEHIYKHIIKKHIWQVFIWLFAAIFIIGLIQANIGQEITFSGANLFYVLIIASLIGILPISGPNVFFIVMFSKGMIPFSVLLANSIIQDGHGLLPIMGFSMKDTIKIKSFNFVFGFIVGLILLLAGF